MRIATTVAHQMKVQPKSLIFSINRKKHDSQEATHIKKLSHNDEHKFIRANWSIY